MNIRPYRYSQFMNLDIVVISLKQRKHAVKYERNIIKRGYSLLERRGKGTFTTGDISRTNAKWKGHWIGRCRGCVHRVAFTTMTFLLCVKRACCPLQSWQTRICKMSFRRFIPARPIKHKDHARIVQPDVTDAALSVPLMVALATVSPVSSHRGVLSPLRPSCDRSSCNLSFLKSKEACLVT